LASRRDTMNSSLVFALVACVAIVAAQQYDDEEIGFEKRAMRNALVRFGRSSGGMRNALVRFGKRSDPEMESAQYQDKRNGAPQPFVRFGRSGQTDHMHDILSTLARVQASSSLFDGKDDSGGTCSQDKKTCGGEEKKAPTKKKTAPLDISTMWKKPDPAIALAFKGHYYDEEKYEGKVAQTVLKKLEEKYRVLEERCSQLSGVCYEVVDRVWRNPEGFETNKWEMLRQVQLKGQIDSHFGRAVLVKPEVLNWKTFDTRKWEVNKYVVIDREIQSLIGALTGSKAIPREEKNATRDYQILLVGLGTPVIPNFIEKYHWMDLIVVEREPLFEYLAKKWFNMRKHPNLRILNADPVSFMSFVVAERHEVDAVLINECKDHVDARPCPANVYLERGTMDVIKKVVRQETGVLGVNSRSSVKTHERSVANAYEGAFPMCFDYPGDHKQLHFERYKATICFNRKHTPFWLQSSRDFTLAALHDFFFYI
ncbi:hypothetical protein PENTCL1PPCAC_29452, partial [Pristionchus entomophagus]